MVWSLFIIELDACCKVSGKYQAVLIESDIYTALQLFVERFGNVCAHNKIWKYDADYGVDLDMLWRDKNVRKIYGSKSLYELGVVDKNDITRVMTSQDILVIRSEANSKVIMPNGVDGVVCSQCREFWPYVEASLGYICPNCRFKF